MSLRAEVHSAFDQIAPSTRGLDERVVSAVLVEISRRNRESRWYQRLRGPLSLVAVLLLIAMVAGVLAGGRLVREWNALHRPTPAVRAEHDSLAELEARRLNLPLLKPGDPCPESPSTAGYQDPAGHFSIGGLYGVGPAYLSPGSGTSTDWGMYWYMAAATDAKLKGLVLVRGRDLRTNQRVVFVGANASGANAAGPAAGTDRLDGKEVVQQLELVFDTSHPSPNYVGVGTFTWPFTAGLPKGESGCIGWQIDGLSFTESIVSLG